MRKLTPAQLRKILREAKKWQGAPYRKGGSDKNGIDCYHFLERLFWGAAGIRLIATWCDWLFLHPNITVVPRHKLKAGHIVFLRPVSGRPKRRIATHVGIYAGNGWMWHAAKSGVSKKRLDRIKKMVMIEKKDPEEIRQWRLENGIP